MARASKSEGGLGKALAAATGAVLVACSANVAPTSTLGPGASGGRAGQGGSGTNVGGAWPACSSDACCDVLTGEERKGYCHRGHVLCPGGSAPANGSCTPKAKPSLPCGPDLECSVDPPEYCEERLYDLTAEWSCKPFTTPCAAGTGCACLTDTPCGYACDDSLTVPVTTCDHDPCPPLPPKPVGPAGQELVAFAVYQWDLPNAAEDPVAWRLAALDMDGAAEPVCTGAAKTPAAACGGDNAMGRTAWLSSSAVNAGLEKGGPTPVFAFRLPAKEGAAPGGIAWAAPPGQKPAVVVDSVYHPRTGALTSDGEPMQSWDDAYVAGAWAFARRDSLTPIPFAVVGGTWVLPARNVVVLLQPNAGKQIATGYLFGRARVSDLTAAGFPMDGTCAGASWAEVADLGPAAAPCDAVSFGVRFTAARVKLGAPLDIDSASACPP